jgi:hypothetical protein
MKHEQQNQMNQIIRQANIQPGQMILQKTKVALKVLLLLITISISTSAYSQEYTRTDSIKHALIVPKNITECFNYLDTIVKPYVDKGENIFTFWHFGIGLWIRNNWISTNPELWTYFKSFGYSDPDRISGIIEMGYEQYLKGTVGNPEKWIASQKEEMDKIQMIVDGKIYPVGKRPDVNPAKIESVWVLAHRNKIQKYLNFPPHSLQIVTKKSTQKSDRILKNRNHNYNHLRKSFNVNDIMYTFQGDTIRYDDLVGIERKILLKTDSGAKPIVNVIIKL